MIFFYAYHEIDVFMCVCVCIYIYIYTVYVCVCVCVLMCKCIYLYDKSICDCNIHKHNYILLYVHSISVLSTEAATTAVESTYDTPMQTVLCSTAAEKSVAVESACVNRALVLMLGVTIVLRVIHIPSIIYIPVASLDWLA